MSLEGHPYLRIGVRLALSDSVKLASLYATVYTTPPVQEFFSKAGDIIERIATEDLSEVGHTI